MDQYWNHNTEFHKEIVADALKRGGRILDVGCGDGLLLQRLAPFAQEVVGIDMDKETILLAQKRLKQYSNVSLITGDFLEMPLLSQDEQFSTIICIATLHHMELESALIKMKNSLASGGRLIIIGLAANKSIVDYILAGLSVIPIRIFDRLHGGAKGPPIRITNPKESISEIRKVVHKILPGAEVKRRFYFRYSMTWNKP